MANGTIAFDTLTTSDSVKSNTEKSIDTSYIFNGVAKIWVNYTHTTTTAIRDSLNMSSITDLDTGSSTLTFANNMNNDDFAQSNGIGDFGTQFNNSTALGQDGNSSKTTALTKLHVAGQTANTAYDHHETNVIVHGDLA